MLKSENNQVLKNLANKYTTSFAILWIRTILVLFVIACMQELKRQTINHVPYRGFTSGGQPRWFRDVAGTTVSFRQTVKIALQMSTMRTYSHGKKRGKLHKLIKKKLWNGAIWTTDPVFSTKMSSRPWLRWDAQTFSRANFACVATQPIADDSSIASHVRGPILRALQVGIITIIAGMLFSSRSETILHTQRILCTGPAGQPVSVLAVTRQGEHKSLAKDRVTKHEFMSLVRRQWEISLLQMQSANEWLLKHVLWVGAGWTVRQAALRKQKGNRETGAFALNGMWRIKELGSLFFLTVHKWCCHLNCGKSFLDVGNPSIVDTRFLPHSGLLGPAGVYPSGNVAKAG